jgi:hypothetical protein
MSEIIKCPKCGDQIEVTEVLSAQLRIQLRHEFEGEFRGRESDVGKREAALKAQKDALAVERTAIDTEIASRLTTERAKLATEAAAKARESVSLEMIDMQTQLGETRTKLEEAQQTELKLRKERRELEEQKKSLELEVTRQVDAQLDTIREKTKHEANEEFRLKEAEYKKKEQDLCEQIDVLKRKSEQGSQQLQGEVLELDLEAILRREFAVDEIVPVPKGVHGGDVVHVVRDSSGTDCGTILWESKRTKVWSDKWLPKLRDDQRNAKAHIAIVVSDELPKVVTTFGYIDEVWVTNRACCIGLAIALRSGMLQLAAARRSLQGQQGKMELLYNYLSSSQFRNRVSAIVEAFTTLREDLEDEKRAMNRLWAKREKQIDRARDQTAGMYGDLQGIIGGSLQVIEPLELTALPSPNGEAESLSAVDALPR